MSHLTSHSDSRDHTKLLNLGIADPRSYDTEMSLVLNTIVHTSSPPTDLDSKLSNSNLTVAPPLSRRGHGPGLLLLVDAELDLRKHEKTLDPPPLHKWAEEGFAVAQLRIAKSESGQIRDGLRSALSELARLPTCDQVDKIGIISERADNTRARESTTTGLTA